MSWGKDADTVIKQALADLADENLPIDELFKRISRDYYPFGERAHWPYKAWLAAIKRNKAAVSFRQRVFTALPADASPLGGLFEGMADEQRG